ncbi:MAG: hypothetical protein EXR75_15460 [Myxococcales bacterium]|nr:hypothetical protein [Myxococcales bacterium]
MTTSTKPTGKSRLGCIALLLLTVVLGAGAYFYVTRVLLPEPSAHRHVPLGTHLVVRADLVEIVASKPVREHILPVLVQARVNNEADPNGLGTRLAKKTGVRFPDDVREFIGASSDGLRWVLIVGGSFERGRFVTGLEEFFREEGIGGWSRDGELLVHGLGAAIGQADDGTLVFATHRESALAALPARAADDAAVLPTAAHGALSFAIDAAAWSGGLLELGAALPALDTLAKVARVDGAFVLDSPPRLELSLWPKAETTPAALKGDIDSALTVLKLAALIMPVDPMGARQALRDATMTADDEAVRVRAPWPEAPLNHAASALAELLRPLLARSPSP